MLCHDLLKKVADLKISFALLKLSAHPVYNCYGPAQVSMP